MMTYNLHLWKIVLYLVSNKLKTSLMKQTLSQSALKLRVQKFLLSFTIIFLLNGFIVSTSSAQDITFNLKSYKGGYNVSCKGSTDGSIDATIVGGTAPYTYSWSNGASSQDLSNIGAGIYSLTVTDAAGSTKSKSVTLFEADLIEVSLSSLMYEGGYQISKMGANDGSITTDVTGGAPPYKYLWSNGSQKANLSTLTAGTYSVVVTDQNGCTVTKTSTLLEPTPITLTLSATTYGAYNTRCFESKDGNINLTVSGGMPPYRYNWNNGSFEEDLNNIGAGIYKVEVTDANKAVVSGQITITEPSRLLLSLTSPVYGNGYNVSCTSCFNGSITTSVTGGTSPTTYLWTGPGTANGQTTSGLSSLGTGSYTVLVKDANNCSTTDKISLTEPAGSAWDKNGSIADNTNFLGTTNNAPLVFKTNNAEGMRISETGNVGIGTATPAFKLDVNGDANVGGNLRTMGSFTFAGNKTISFTPPTGGSPALFDFGGGTFVPDPCLLGTPIGTLNLFEGFIQAQQTATGGTSGALSMGFDTENGIIDLAGSGATGNASLLINYHCGKDIYMCTGGAGYVRTGKNFEVGNPVRDEFIAVNVEVNDQTGMFLTTSHSADFYYNTKLAVNRDKTKALAVYNNTSSTENFVVFGDGKVSIGDVYYNPGYMLAVKGQIIAEELNVKLRGAWPDYVFKPEYKLMPINELEVYLKENNHLPQMPTDAEAEKNGVNTSEMITKLLKQQEELTLYIIQQNKRIETLENQLKK